MNCKMTVLTLFELLIELLILLEYAEVILKQFHPKPVLLTEFSQI